MKALSVKQPWAHLICTPRIDNPLLGIKDIENRTWQTHFRGRIYIHASGTPAKEPYQIFTDEQAQAFIDSDLDFEMLKSYSETSRIIGEVDIVDCVVNHSSIWAEQSDFCPITGRKFFMRIEDQSGKMVNTYGGPYHSYTIPVPDETCKGEFITQRYDHDLGGWREDETCNQLTGIPKDRKPTWNWVLANPVLYEKPILNVKGKLSFWEYKEKTCDHLNVERSDGLDECLDCGTKNY
jgi:hypothetical protein